MPLAGVMNFDVSLYIVFLKVIHVQQTEIHTFCVELHVLPSTVS